jgi:hypothetical protein
MKSASCDFKVEFDEKGNTVSTQRNDDTLLKNISTKDNK